TATPKRVATKLAATSLTALLTIPLLTATNIPTAHANIGPNPHVDVNIQKTFDGTGHGTGSATFVNSDNGYTPGDNTPNDGIVSSPDTVGYDITLHIKAGLERTVAVTMNGTDHLEWLHNKDSFCAPLPGITTNIVDDTCLF